MEWLRDKLCTLIEIKNNEMIHLCLVEKRWNQWLLSKKSYAQEINTLGDLTTNHTSVKQYGRL